MLMLCFGLQIGQAVTWMIYDKSSKTACNLWSTRARVVRCHHANRAPRMLVLSPRLEASLDV